MRRSLVGFGFLLVSFILVSCGLFQPEMKNGSIVITMKKENSEQLLEKTATTLASVHCTVQKGSSSVYDQNLIKNNDGSFDAQIPNLKPGNDYSVLLYGYQDDTTIIGRAHRDGIIVTAGETRSVDMSWGSFRPLLYSPIDSIIITDNTPTFEWSEVSGVSVYELWFTNAHEIGSTETKTLTTNYTQPNILPDGTYYWAVRCQNEQGDWGDWSIPEAFIIATNETGTVTDIDRNNYKTVKIGNQWWMAENLKVTHYRNLDKIPEIIDNTDWSNQVIGAYCFYDNNENEARMYGYLYNWYTVNDSRNIAPSGWHVPSDAEWQTLVVHLGGQAIAGGKMKETGTTHWRSSNIATNESGFSALPGGYRHNYSGSFNLVDNVAYFWSSTEDGTSEAWYRSLYSYDSNVNRSSSYKEYGFSIRCVRD